MRLLAFPLLILSIFTTALRRLWANLGLALCALVALLVAVALCVSIPVYAEAASLRLLKDELAQQSARNNRSAFALLWRYYVGGANRPLDWERVKPADDYITKTGLPSLQLPLQGLARHARTDQLQLLLPPSSSAQNPFLKNVALGFVSGLDAQMRITDGTAPRAATSLAAPVNALLSRALADEIGVNVGEQLVVVTGGSNVTSIAIRVSGLWEPINAADPAWFYPPDAFRDVVLVPETTYTGPVATKLKSEVSQIAWFARLDGRNLSAEQAIPLLGRIDAARAQAAGLVAGLNLEQSPTDALTRYRRGADLLTLELFVFSVPILALVLYFAGLIAAMLVNRQRAEIALLKTRGVRDTQILGVYVVEWLLLGGLALAGGPLLGLRFAETIGRTQSFLQLASDAPTLSLTLTPRSLWYGVGVVVLALLAALFPALVATRSTLVDEQQQAARASRRPLWQRWYLDFVLLVPPLYGLYQLRTTGGLQLGATRTADLLANPLLVLVPVLLCFALGLVAVRLIPMILELLARIATLPSWTAPLVALRALARQPGTYRGPLLLLVLTLALAAFSASMAATLDGALVQAITYQVGAPTQLIETGESTEQTSAAAPGQSASVPQKKDIQKEARFLFIPVKEHLTVPGVTAAARVATYDDTTIQLGGQTQNAQLVGIDRVDFPNVVNRFDRAWGTGQSLGALMNLLARNPDGVIVSSDALAGGLKIGDPLPVTLRLYGDQRAATFRIVAAVDLWPGFYPRTKAGPVLVANLDYIFDQMGGQYPYDVWIAHQPNADVAKIVDGVRALGVTVVDARDTATLIAEEQRQPRRQGLFGLLSVGFVAAGGLTLLGFLITTLITARRRAVELGVLRALGMAGWQVVLAVIVEQVTLVAAGVGAGTGIGLLAAKLVIPLFNVGVGPQPGTPPYPPQIAWTQVTQIYVVFAAALLLTLLALAWVLGRMRLFQAIKLGDAN